MNTIHHLYRPSRLVLAWQAPGDTSESRKRRAVAEIIEEGSKYIFRYLVDSEDFHEALLHGFDSYPSFSKMKETYSTNVLEILSRRLPPKSRSDYKKFLESNRIDPNTNADIFTILGYVECRLPSDGFSIVNPLDSVQLPCELLLEVAGFRFYYSTHAVYKTGDDVRFNFEPDNIHDDKAVAIYSRNTKIGYINRIQVENFSSLFKSSLNEAVLERIITINSRVSAYTFVKMMPK